MLPTASLLLGDGRFPSGSHAHSHGLEAAHRRGLVADLDDLAAWADGCLATTWRLDAAAAALAARLTADPDTTTDAWAVIDAELAARTTSVAARTTSRSLGRQLLRTGVAAWPDGVPAALRAAHADGPLQPVALGAVAAAGGADAVTAASLSLHHALQGALGAAVRLLGLDPYAVVALAADRCDALDRAAADAASLTAGGAGAAALPSAGAPALEVLLATHARADMRLFAS